jgi:hypothetical protein
VVHPLLDVAHHHGRGEKVVGRDVEEALDLARVQVEREHAVEAGIGDQVRHELGGDRSPGRGFPILPRIAEIRDHGRDAARRGPAQRIGDDEELHQVVVRRSGRRLDDEDVLAAHVLADLDEDLHVREAADTRAGKRDLQILRDRLRKRPVRIPRD